MKLPCRTHHARYEGCELLFLLKQFSKSVHCQSHTTAIQSCGPKPYILRANRCYRGFFASRAREQASDFNAALADHLQALRRAKEAERMRQQYEAAAKERTAGSTSSSSQSSSQFSLKPGETLTINLKPVSWAVTFHGQFDPSCRLAPTSNPL